MFFIKIYNMRLLFIILFTFILGAAYAQEPVYNQMRSNYQFKGVRVDSLLLFPKFNDTTAANNTALDSIAGNVIRVGNTVYYRSTDLKKWLTFSGTAIDTTSLSNRINSKADTSLLNGVIYFSDTLTTIATKSDILSPIDTTSLSNRINSKADSTIDLQKVTDNGNQTTNDIQFTNDNNLLLDTFSSMLFPNYSRIKEGTIDAEFGGNKGVALVCGLGYEYKWEGGMLFVMNGSGNYIREAKYMFNYIPQDTNDLSEGYYVGSRWILDNGDTYICSDNSINAAVWDLQPNAFDSTSLSNRINDKIDSLKKENDTVYFKKDGIWFSSFKDSVGGGGQNGRWGNDTAMVILAKVHNDAGSILQRGEVVMLKGSNGDVASVIRASNKYDSTSALTIGIVKDDIAVNDTGWIVTQGQISKMKTQDFNEGDALYLDSIPGKLTNVKPIAPLHGVFVGIVERANNGNGLIYTKPQNGYELTEIHDVRIVNPINNQVLIYSDTQDLWKNRNIYSIVDTTSLSSRINLKLNSSDTSSLSNRINLKLNISDTATMLSPYLREADTSSLSSRINAKLNISDTSVFLRDSDSSIYQTKYRTDTMRTNIYTSLASKESPLTFSTGLTRSSNTITNNLSTGVSGGQSINGGTSSADTLRLFSTTNATKGKIIFGSSTYDEANNRLGLGITTPTTIQQINLSNTDFTNTNGAGSHIYLTNPSSTGQNVVASFINGSLVAKWRTDYVGNISWAAGSTGAHDFYTGGDYAVGSIKLRIFNGGNVQVATSAVGGANVDAGFKLDVQGTGRYTSTLLTTGIRVAYSSKSANYTTLATDEVIAVDASGAARTITLLTASSRAGQKFSIKKTDNSVNAVTINTTSSQTIDGASTYTLSNQYDGVTVISNGSNWLIIK